MAAPPVWANTFGAAAIAVAAAPVVSMVRRTGSIIGALLDHVIGSRLATLYAARAAAIDIDDLAGHETGALGTEEKDHGRHLLGCPDAAERDARNGAAVVLLGRHAARPHLSLIHISEPTRLLSISYAVFCLKKKRKT